MLCFRTPGGKTGRDLPGSQSHAGWRVARPRLALALPGSLARLKSVRALLALQLLLLRDSGLLLLLGLRLHVSGAQHPHLVLHPARHQRGHQPRQVGRVRQWYRSSHVRCPEHGGQLAGDDLLLHLLGQRVLQCQVVSPVDEELVLQVLRRVEILAGRLLSVTPTLNTVVAGGHSPVLHLHVWRRMGELALAV